MRNGSFVLLVLLRFVLLVGLALYGLGCERVPPRKTAAERAPHRLAEFIRINTGPNRGP